MLGWVRLALGIAILVLLWPPRWWAALAFALFLVAGWLHSAVLRKLAAARRTVAYLEHAEARNAGAWRGLRRRQTRADLTASLYADDLDLFGDNSLFELLCEARTSLGEDALTQWLLHPAPPAAVRERQAAVTELRERLTLRERCAATAGPPLASIDTAALSSWSQATAAPLPAALQVLAPLLVVLTLAAAVRYALTRSPVLLVAALVMDASLTFGFQRAAQALFGEAERTSHALGTAAELLSLLESETFSAPLLMRLQEELRMGRRSAAEALAQLARLARWAEGNRNMLVRVLTIPLLYSLQLALALQRWRSQYGPALGGWLALLGDFEALLSLAAFSFEHPAYAFPTLDEGPASFHASELAHPLLPAKDCVRNDVSLGPTTRLLLISGSNMSGKSTLLRSVGINCVLAFAGAPVCARVLSLTPLTVAASIHVNDSLQQGHSRFYAEILRLRSILKAAHDHPPVLFLIDEVLAGTNSRDRLAGARGLLRDLLRRNAIGLMTTHDLALTSLGQTDTDPIRNKHFEDQVIDDRVLFDFILRDGVLQRSNGAALMRMIGINV